MGCTNVHVCGWYEGIPYMVCMLNDVLSAGAIDLTFTHVLYDSCSASPAKDVFFVAVPDLSKRCR